MVRDLETLRDFRQIYLPANSQFLSPASQAWASSRTLEVKGPIGNLRHYQGFQYFLIQGGFKWCPQGPAQNTAHSCFWGSGFKHTGIFREKVPRKLEFCLQTSLYLGRPSHS